MKYSVDEFNPCIVLWVVPTPDIYLVVVQPPHTPYHTKYPVMSPLRWMQFTGPHCTVMLEEVMSNILMEVGGAEGAAVK